MDKFAWGAIVLALVIEAFLVWGWTLSPQDEGNLTTLLVASLLPLVLVLVTILIYRLQREA